MIIPVSDFFFWNGVDDLFKLIRSERQLWEVVAEHSLNGCRNREGEHHPNDPEYLRSNHQGKDTGYRVQPN